MKFATHIAIAALTVAMNNMAYASNPISIAISESGQPSEWVVDIQGRTSSYVDIITPDGSILEPNLLFGFRGDVPTGPIEFQQSFDSLDLALEFVAGDWTTTEVERGTSDNTTFMREFSVSPIGIDAINRSLPVIASPASSFEAQNGEAFLLAFDYETFPGENEVPNRSVIWRQRTDPPEGGFSRSISSTPNGGGSGFSSTGGPDFNVRLEAEPGATTNRWLFTATSNQTLPQTFDIRVGSHFELNDFVDAPLLDPDNPRRGQIAELTYSRYADTLSLTLAGEPTPPCMPASGIVGDLDGNGTVEFRDFLVVSQNFGRQATSYEEGDTNCDGFVSFSDFLDISANFGRSASAVAPVPEPSTFALFLCSVGTLLLRARQKRTF